MADNTTNGAGQSNGAADTGDQPLSMDQITQMMGFDPFAPETEKGSGADGEGQDDGDSGNDQGDANDQGQQRQAPADGGDQGDTQQSGSTAPPTPKPGQGQTPEAGQTDDQKRSLETLQGLVSSLLAKQGQQTGDQQQPTGQGQQPQGQSAAGTQPQPQGQPGAAAEPAAPYKIQVPPQVAEAMASDDPALRQHAVSALASAVMNQLYRDFSQALLAMREEMRREMSTEVPRQLEERQRYQRVQEDFYSNFPALAHVAKANPMIGQTMWQVVGQLAQAAQVKEWTEEFRNQAGEYLHMTLGIPRTQVVASQQPSGQQQQSNGGRSPRRGAFAAGGSSRPGGGSGGNQEADARTQSMIDVLDIG